MTDNEIIKALKYCKDCSANLNAEIINLINRQQAENDDLLYKLTGVMHFVDKWLDGAELEQDEVNRAATMREKTLRLIESAKDEARSDNNAE